MTAISASLGVSRLTGKSKFKASSAGNSASSSIPKDLKQKILDRDNHVCQCCGFQARKYQDVLCKNGNLLDLSEGNLISACIFCHQCFHLDDVSTMRSGVLLWLPEIKQTDLHHIARAIYVARISQGPIADAARRALDALMKRREAIRDRISTDDPYILASVLKDYLTDNHYSGREKKLEGVRLFPLDRRIIKESDLEFNQFPQILAYWRSKDGPFGGKAPQKWFDIFHQVNAA